MREIRPGDIVSRRSYGGDVFFKVQEIITGENGEKTAILKGLEMRLIADAGLEDLMLKEAADILHYRHNSIQKNAEYMRRIQKKRLLERSQNMSRAGDGTSETAGDDFFDLPATVLHLDGDKEYLNKCLRAYEQLGLPVQGYHIAEKDQPAQAPRLVRELGPDILVMTGHDGLVKKKPDFTSLESYRNSKYFVQAVKGIRQLLPHKDGLVIFAGACQSHYEALLKAGANFASAPRRILIHAYDPVYVVEKIAFTSIKKVVDLVELVANTITGASGIGGIETKGKYRQGYPRSPY
ncbi:MAG: sporulation peptidase YabG [Syntrophomonadaceae bacterium]|nr:sporulation peptidase YabG [Syntrophomonadaceae bacterium]